VDITPPPFLDSPPSPPALVGAPPSDPGPTTTRGGASPVAARPSATPRAVAQRPASRGGVLGIGALLAFVGIPSTASATDMVPGLPPELGAWGLVAYGLVRVVQELLTWRRDALADQAAREEVVRLRAELDDARRRERERDAADDQRRENALAEALAEIARLKG
jgi:hypothetical protein